MYIYLCNMFVYSYDASFVLNLCYGDTDSALCNPACDGTNIQVYRPQRDFDLMCQCGSRGSTSMGHTYSYIKL